MTRSVTFVCFQMDPTPNAGDGKNEPSESGSRSWCANAERFSAGNGAWKGCCGRAQAMSGNSSSDSILARSLEEAEVRDCGDR